MIECKICGHKSKYRLIEHIQKTHKMDIDHYKSNYGEVVSEEYKEKVSNKSKDKWNETLYRNKTIESRKWIYSNEDIKDRISKTLKKYYKDGGKSWNEGLTKENNDILSSIGEKNKNHLTGRTKENYSYLKKHSDLMTSLWNESNLKKRRDEIHNDPILKKVWAEKISTTISNKILNGELGYNNYVFFKTGWYENDFGKYWYDSSLELESMKIMDNLNIDWCKNNRIKIKYTTEDNAEHNYIPDFILKIKNIEYIIEMKGRDWDGFTELKTEEAIKLYGNNYKLFYSIEELESFLKINI